MRESCTEEGEALLLAGEEEGAAADLAGDTAAAAALPGEALPLLLAAPDQGLSLTELHTSVRKKEYSSESEPRARFTASMESSTAVIWLSRPTRRLQRPHTRTGAAPAVSLSSCLLQLAHTQLPHTRLQEREEGGGGSGGSAC